ncbi:MAG: DUF5780 domain-containing protein [Anaerolineales bacterium]
MTIINTYRTTLWTHIGLLVSLLSILLAGCSPTPNESSTQAQGAAVVPLPTYTAYPTYTPYPTFTPQVSIAIASKAPEVTTTPTTAWPLTPTLTPEQLDEKLAAQPLVVVSTKYIVQDSEYKSLYPDMLSATVQNNSDDNIRDLVVAFAAWDSNGLPVLLRGSLDFSGGSYVKKAKAEGVNLIPGATWGQHSGFALDSGLNIDTFVAIAVSYTTFDGKEWTNEYYEDWRRLYEGKVSPR